MAGSAKIGDEAPHDGSCNGPFKGEDLGEDAPVLGLGPVGEPPGCDIEESIAVGESGEVHSVL